MALTRSSWDEVLDGAQVFDEPERSRLRRALELARDRFLPLEGRVRFVVAEFKDYSREDRRMPLWVSAADGSGGAGATLEEQIAEQVSGSVLLATRISMPVLIEDRLPHEGLDADSQGVLLAGEPSGAEGWDWPSATWLRRIC